MYKRTIKTNLDDLRLWMTSCGCQKPALHWSKDFNARMCNNCGVILTGISEADELHDERILGSHDREHVLEEREVLDHAIVPSHTQVTADNFQISSPQQYVGEIPERQDIPYTSSFVHLRVHTHLSLLKATCLPSDLIKIAKEFCMPALAKTEFGNMCGAPTFVRDCEREGIKPILGVEFSVNFGEVMYPVTFLALNRDGYKQLVKMTTTAWCERKAKKVDPHILVSDIPSGTKDLIALVDIGMNPQLSEVALGIWGMLETYIEVNKEEHIEMTMAFQQKWNLPIVVTGNVLYTNEEDRVAAGVGLKIGKHSDILKLPDHVDNWFKPPIFYGTGFEFPQEWVKTTLQIANRVESYGLVNKGFIVPTYKDENKEYTDFTEVHRKLEIESWRGLYEKGKSADPKYQERLQYELDVMKEKDFSSYFLLINEIVLWMKKNKIMVPFGRGSSVGSLVCYALDITTMDPIEWGVPFERFINSGRIDLPDIDTDISQERRSEVLSHIADVHGHDRVAHIATYQTMALRAAIDNSGRAFQVPHIVNRDLRKIIPDDVVEWDKLDDSTKTEVEGLMSFQSQWLDVAKALTGTAKNLGCHAAGVIISNEALGELVPLMPPPEDDGLLGIQYDMHDCDVLGLLKLDMLGLRNIDIIQYTLDRIKTRHNIDLDVYNLPSDDKATYDLISEANYVSIFQLDSTGYRRLCRQLSPENFYHLMALNALFRPGPLEGGMTDEFVKRRHGKKDIIGWHPWLDDVLSITYQVPIFQEQVMAIAKNIAGFNDVEADKYRKAIGKKDAVKFAAAQKQFKEGALKRPGLEVPVTFSGSLEAWIDDLLEKLAGYARYGWNIGHSCLKGDSLVSTCDRGLVPIKDIKIGEEVWSIREDTGDLFRNRVLNVVNNGVRDDILSIGASSRSITCTSDHRLFTTKHSYVYSSKLILGDSLKMIDEGTSDGDFNSGMAGIADRDHIPVISGGVVDSIESKQSCEVWDLTMEQNPNYIANGFVVHNCGYGWITYVTAYLETHYPQEYYASLLDAFRGNNKRLPTLLRSILGSGKCKIVPPNVNESFIDYEVGSDNNIYMGLAAVRNVGKAAPEIIAERVANGSFRSFIEFCQRLPKVNKTAKVNLVRSGAFSWDRMLCDRDKVDNIDVIQKIVKKRNKKFDGSKVSPYEVILGLEGVNGHDYTELEMSKNERESLNSFITGHPAAIYHRLSPYLERGNTRAVLPTQISNMECEIGESVLIVGMVDYIYRKMTRENPERNQPSRPYLNISMSDSEGLIITNVWWPLCEDLQKIIIAGEIAMLECVVKPDKFRDDKVMLRVDNAINLANGLPVQGVFRLNGNDPTEVVTKIGGIVNNISTLGHRQYASIRGRITVQPHLLDEAINEFGRDIKFLVSMDTLDANI